MTFRSAAIGLVIAAAISAFSYFNGNIIGQPGLVANYLPIGIFGMLILFALAVNPLLALLRRSLALSGRELAVVVLITCVAGCVPGGVLGSFNPMVIMPHHLETNTPAWRDANVLQQIPRRMLADPTKRDGRNPLDDYIKGIGKEGQHIGLSDIPWGAWRRPLEFWMPLLIAFSVATIGLALVVHPQWSANEKLRYPIATFAASLMPGESSGRPAVFRNGLFWMGGAVVFCIQMINYAHKWNDEILQIPLHVDLRPVFQLSEAYIAGCPGDILMMPTVLFTVVGFTYFLDSDVSLSLGLGPHICTYVLGVLMLAGVPVLGGVMDASGSTFLFGGAWTGIFLMVLYTGRRYFAGTLRRALFLGGPERIKGYSVWGARVFLAGSAVVVGILIHLGLHWSLAIVFAAGTVMIYVVVARLVAETGLYLINPFFWPGIIMLGFFGMATIGPTDYVTMMLLGIMLLMAAGAGPMPFAVQGLKIIDIKGGKCGRSTGMSVAALLIAFVIAVPTALYFEYDRGAYAATSEYAAETTPRYPIDAAIRAQKQYEPPAGYPTLAPTGGLARFADIEPNWNLLTYFAIALGLVLLFAAARLRFPWWPLHPVMFCVLVVYQAQWFAWSFLFGWLAKKTIHGLGGARAYERFKPLMIGLIAGEVFSRAAGMVIGAAYYFRTGIKPLSG